MNDLICDDSNAVCRFIPDNAFNAEIFGDKPKGQICSVILNKCRTIKCPDALPALVKAYRIQDKVANVGFDWEKREDVWAKVKEEIAEFEAEVENMDEEKATEEMGDLFFALVNAARLYNVRPDNALEKTNAKFIRRFNYVEQKAKEKGLSLKEMTLDEMEALWQEAKTAERR